MFIYRIANYSALLLYNYNTSSVFGVYSSNYTFNDVKFGLGIYLVLACSSNEFIQFDYEIGHVISSFNASSVNNYIGWIADFNGFVDSPAYGTSSLTISKYVMTNVYSCKNLSNVIFSYGQECPACLATYALNQISDCQKNYGAVNITNGNVITPLNPSR